jgi:hypothetical protein
MAAPRITLRLVRRILLDTTSVVCRGRKCVAAAPLNLSPILLTGTIHHIRPLIIRRTLARTRTPLAKRERDIPIEVTTKNRIDQGPAILGER